MKKILYILIVLFFQNLSSQEMCDTMKNVLLFKENIENDTVDVISKLNNIKRSGFLIGGNAIVDFALAKIYLEKGNKNKAKALFSKILNKEKLFSDGMIKCYADFMDSTDDIEEFFQLSEMSEWKIKLRSYEYLSAIEFENKNYEEALKNLELSLVEKRKHKRKYTCFNDFYTDVSFFERKRFHILKKMGQDSLANYHGSKIMFLNNDCGSSDFLRELIFSLEQELPRINIKSEILKNVNNLKRDTVIINGLKYNSNFITLFDKQIVFFREFGYCDKITLKNYISKCFKELD